MKCDQRIRLGESIPIRLFLAGYDLTPTMKDVQKKFSVRYYLNLVLIDEEERRYFKQQVRIWSRVSFTMDHVLWRKSFFGENQEKSNRRTRPNNIRITMAPKQRLAPTKVWKRLDPMTILQSMNLHRRAIIVIHQVIEITWIFALSLSVLC